jgi:hypothetical protein
MDRLTLCKDGLICSNVRGRVILKLRLLHEVNFCKASKKPKRVRQKGIAPEKRSETFEVEYDKENRHRKKKENETQES